MADPTGFVLPSGMPRDDLSSKRPEAPEKAGGTGSPDAPKTGDRPFVTTWQTTSPNEPITIPVGNATGVYTVDWGDGSTSANLTGDQSHAYGDAGTYTIAITGNFERIRLNGDPDNAPKLQSIEQWGDVRWTSMESAFSGASNMIYNAADAPDLSDVTDMSCMFAGATQFDGDLSGWDVSRVKNMSCMFAALPGSYAHMPARRLNMPLQSLNCRRPDIRSRYGARFHLRRFCRYPCLRRVCPRHRYVDHLEIVRTKVAR